MIDVFRFQIGTYIALNALFGSFVVHNGYSDFSKYAFIANTIVFTIEMTVWLYYVTSVSTVLNNGLNVFLTQNLITAVFVSLLGILAAFALLLPD